MNKKESNDNTEKPRFYLSEAAKEACEKIMKIRGLSSIEEAIRISISDELNLLDQSKGWRIILQNRKNNDQVKEVLLR